MIAGSFWKGVVSSVSELPPIPAREELAQSTAQELLSLGQKLGLKPEVRIYNIVSPTTTVVCSYLARMLEHSPQPTRCCAVCSVRLRAAGAVDWRA